jgi:four helix bundle protein
MADDRKSIQSYRDLLVWQKGMDLAVAAYRLTKLLPAEERYGLSSQIRRASASVPANIAEGYGRDSAGAYAQHLRIAQGSLKEFETHILLASRVELISSSNASPVLESADEIGKMLRSLIRSVER